MDRRTVLAIALLVLVVLSAVVLEAVLWTVVFAVTVAYVLSPLRAALAQRGFGRQAAAATTAVAATVGALLVLAPIAVLLWARLGAAVALLRSIPAELPVTVGGFVVVVDTAPYVVAVTNWLRGAAVSLAADLPVLALKATLFAIVVYGLLARPEAPRRAAEGFVPAEYRDLLEAYHERVRATLMGIYVLQAATALATVLIGLVVFWALGYSAPFTLAVVAGVLQFVPIVGPSILIVALAVADVLAGEVVRAVLVSVLGLVFVGFVPDAVVRPRLARVAADIPVTLYFVGFVGGVLTLGPVGFVVGPLVIALLVETVALLSVIEQRAEERAAAESTDAGTVGGESVGSSHGVADDPGDPDVDGDCGVGGDSNADADGGVGDDTDVDGDGGVGGDLDVDADGGVGGNPDADGEDSGDTDVDGGIPDDTVPDEDG